MATEPDVTEYLKPVEPDLTFAEVWDKLSAISVKDHIQKKGGLSYLSWAWAWGVMMENYPEAQFFFDKPTSFPDGSMQVNCTVSIRNLHRDMWLPVMDYKNKAIPNPSARDISDAQMRCLVKCFALFGLGHYIYAGEDIPRTNERNRLATKKKEEAEPAPAPTPVAQGSIEDIPSAASMEVSAEKEDVHRASEDFFMEFLNGCDNVESLRAFWQDNKPALKALEQESKERFDRVLAAFKSRQEEIKTEAA